MSMSATVSRREEKRDERRELILDVAKDCFLVYGYAATSMSAIAARLGGSKGTLYNYFKSKDELFAAMMQRQCAELSEAMFDVEDVDGHPSVWMIAFARRFLETLLAPEPLAIQRLVVAEGERFPELPHAFYDSGPRMVMARIAGRLEELMDRGALRKADPMIAAQHFKDLTFSGIYQQRLWGLIADVTPEQIDTQVECAVDTFLRAYAP